jgi:glycosyltransferase involved in cell wall biosynthesis
LREGAPDVPVWLYCTVSPDDETGQRCERVVVRRSGLALFAAAQREAWPRWVALSVAAWTGRHGGWALKIGPWLIPPHRVLVLNEHGDFLHGSPANIARHLGRRSSDFASTVWNGARTAAHIVGNRLRLTGSKIRSIAVEAALRMLGVGRHVWFPKLHGHERLSSADPSEEAAAEVVDRVPAGLRWREKLNEVAWTTDARWILWGEGEATPEMLELFDDPRTFAVSRQEHFRAWKRAIVPTAPFRTLQPGEFSQVLAPVSDCVLVDRRKLIALGVPNTSFSTAAWLMLFWKAAAAGWRSYSAGGAATLKEQPDLPVHESAFFLRTIASRTLLRLGPAEPELSRGAVSFSGGIANPDRREKPRVLVVSPFLPYPLSHGGAVRIWNLSRALADRVDFILAAVREKDERVEYGKLREVFREVRVVDIDERLSEDRSLPGQVRGHQSRAMRALIASIVREWRPDLLQVEYTHMAHFRDAAPGVPAILVEHDLTFTLYRQLADARPSPESEAEHDRWREYERRWLKAYDGVWTVSETDRAAAVRASGRPDARTFNVPNGVDVERFRPEPDGPAQEILYVGSFRHLPNIIGFEKLEREIMPRVWRQFPDARLRVVAGPRHKDYWTPRQVDARIEIHGFVEDLRPMYAGAAVAAVPLEVSAGTNIKVLEAMACGKPVVSTPIGCAGLDLIDGVDAVVRADPDGFAAAICELLSDSAARDRIGSRARRTAEDRFSWTAIGERAWRSYCAVNVAVEICNGSV